MKVSVYPDVGKLNPDDREDLSRFLVDAKSVEWGFERGVASSPSGRLVFKTFPLSQRRSVDRFRSRWKIASPKFGQRFGWGEWRNVQRANSSGIRVARPVAYIEMSNFIGCSVQVLASENLVGQQTLLAQMIKAGKVSNEMLSGVESVIFSLARAGVFHADLNCRNILSPDGVCLNFSVIDWEYACFGRRKLGNLYEYYLGYVFFDGINQFLPERTFDSWATQVMSDRADHFNADQNEMIGFYAQAKKNFFSRQLRYRLFE